MLNINKKNPQSLDSDTHTHTHAPTHPHTHTHAQRESLSDACHYRWLENVEPAQRILDILPNIEAFCSATKKKTVSQPSSKSFKDVVSMLRDPLLRSKLEFFVCLARDVEPFLSLYQTDRPMVPFLFDDLTYLLKSLMKRIVKPEVISESTELKNVCSVNVKEKENLRDPSKVDIGFCARRSVTTSKASDRERFSFRAECRECLLDS